MWGRQMSEFFIGKDSEIDVARCRASMHNKTTIIVFGLSPEGRIGPFIGIVQSIDFDSTRQLGKRWRVTMSNCDPSDVAASPENSTIGN
jgi:hypothetical protein